MTNSASWYDYFVEVGAIWHYRLGGPHVVFERAPHHADFYFNTAIIAANATLRHDIAATFAAHIRSLSIKPDFVVSTKAGIADGSVFATDLANELSIPTCIVDLETNTLTLLPQTGSALLLITDDIVTGSSAARAIDAFEKYECRVLPLILTLANFSGQATLGKYSLYPLMERTIDLHLPEYCPLCRGGSPLLKARTEWKRLINKST